MTLHPIAALLVATTVLAACATPTESELALVVALDAREFARDSVGNVVVPFRVSNAGSTTVYLPTCGTTVTADIERRNSPTGWATSAAGASCYLSLYLGPRRLEPGQSVSGVQSARLSTGEYRLRVLVSRDAQQNPNQSATSDVISIR